MLLLRGMIEIKDSKKMSPDEFDTRKQSILIRSLLVIISLLVLSIIVLIIYSKITGPQEEIYTKYSNYHTNSVYSNSISNNYEVDESESDTVYRGKTGTKYHKKNCSSLKGKGIPISKEDAIEQGREPCKICY